MKHTKRQNLPPGLWVVATPIGNLGDLTDRALQALTQAGRILCEDTRRTATLLSALGLAVPKLERSDAHTQTEGSLSRWIEALQSGERFALVTDAGTPAISDPGSLLVAACQRAGIQVTPIPGASAVMALLSASGFSETAFTFLGFFPRKTTEQKQAFENAAQSLLSRVFVWFESPFRIGEALELLAQDYPNSKVVAAKELTKIYEKFFVGLASEVFLQIQNEIQTEGERGEWCFAVDFGPSTQDGIYEKEAWFRAVKCCLQAGVSVSITASQVSQEFGIPKKQVYQTALEFAGNKTKSVKR